MRKHKHQAGNKFIRCIRKFIPCLFCTSNKKKTIRKNEENEEKIIKFMTILVTKHVELYLVAHSISPSVSVEANCLSVEATQFALDKHLAE